MSVDPNDVRRRLQVIKYDQDAIDAVVAKSGVPKSTINVLVDWQAIPMDSDLQKLEKALDDLGY